MNKKGFTLVELLATITILALLAIIASTSVTKVVKESKKELHSTQIKQIESAAEAWGAKNLKMLPNKNECKYLTIKDLKDYGLLDSSIKNPKTNKEIDENIKIKITTEITKYGNIVTNYEIDPSSIDGCALAMPCKLVNGDKKTPGSKYECEVSPGVKYNFYVLSTESDGTTNLILDRNINSDGTLATKGITEANAESGVYNLVAWYDGGKNVYGPETAIEFLYNATKNWTNIPALKYKYYDKEFQKTTDPNTGYISFIAIEGIATITSAYEDKYTIGTKEEPLRARMPIYTYAYADGVEYGDVSDLKSDNSNAFLYDYLEDDGIQTNIIDGIYGYWTFSTIYDDYNFAWFVAFDSAVLDDSVGLCGDYGVRPVINVRL